MGASTLTTLYSRRRMPGPLPGRSHGVHIPVSSSVSSAFPQRGLGRLPASFREYDFSRGGCFRGCRHFFMFRPPSLLVSQVVPTSAHRAAGQPRLLHPGRTSLPLHAPDMLAVRIQAIDGTRTFTLLDSQPCRPLPSPSPHTARPDSRELPVDRFCNHRWGFPCCLWSLLPACRR
jgi:hypothetical protein